MAEPTALTTYLDFLYRDSNRLTSYYAQMFDGQLASREETETDKESSDKAVRAGVSWLGGDYKRTNETESVRRKIIDPGDVLLTTTITSLVKSGKVHEDPGRAPNGSLIEARGTIHFVDGLVGNLVKANASELFDVVAKLPDMPKDVGLLRTAIGMLGSIPIPSSFILTRSPGPYLVGVLKESGMEEPISAYCFKHGLDGIADIHLLGIKETSHASTLPEAPLMKAQLAISNLLRTLLFPPHLTRVVPLAIYRKI